MGSITWTHPWFSFTEPSVRHNAPAAPGILVIALTAGDCLLVRASLNVQRELLGLLEEPRLVKAGDVIFSTEVSMRSPAERVVELLTSAKPRWGTGGPLDEEAGTALGDTPPAPRIDGDPS